MNSRVLAKMRMGKISSLGSGRLMVWRLFGSPVESYDPRRYTSLMFSTSPKQVNSKIQQQADSLALSGPIPQVPLFEQNDLIL